MDGRVSYLKISNLFYHGFIDLRKRFRWDFCNHLTIHFEGSSFSKKKSLLWMKKLLLWLNIKRRFIQFRETFSSASFAIKSTLRNDFHINQRSTRASLRWGARRICASSRSKVNKKQQETLIRETFNGFLIKSHIERKQVVVEHPYIKSENPQISLLKPLSDDECLKRYQDVFNLFSVLRH